MAKRLSTDALGQDGVEVEDALASFSSSLDDSVFLASLGGPAASVTMSGASTLVLSGSLTINSGVGDPVTDDWTNLPIVLLQLPGTTTGIIDLSDSVDRFVINLVAGHWYHFQEFGSGSDPLATPYLSLYRSVATAGSPPESAVQNVVNARPATGIWYEPTQSGVYYLHASAVSTLQGISGSTYTLTADMPDTGDEYTANTATTGALSVSSSVASRLDVPVDRDWFAISLTAGKSYVLRATDVGGSNGPAVTLIDSSGSVVAYNHNLVSLQFPTSKSLSYTPTTTGTFYFEVASAWWGLPATDYVVSAWESLLGGAGNDTLVGGVANDEIWGLAGDDWVDGGGGADNMIGGPGNDIYTVDSAADQVLESVGQGTDAVSASVDFALGAGQEVEILVASGSTGLKLTGNEFANILIGGSGTDILKGGSGSDSYVVDDATDQVFEAVGAGTDAVYASVSYTLMNGQEIELLGSTSAAPVTLTGNEFANTLIGNLGDDRLYGAGGDDTLYGAGGLDVLIGGDGNDIYGVDATGEKVIEAPGGGNDIVYALVDFALGTGQEVEYVMAGTATGLTLRGNEFANFVVGNAGNDTLYGGGGDDLLSGEGGNDTVYGGGGNDFIFVDSSTDQVFEAAGKGTDSVYALSNFTLGAGQEIEFLLAATPAGLALTGNALANTLVGNAGNDTLYGGGGNDHLSGEGGSDAVYGGGGDDVILVDSSMDQVFEATGKGTDSVYALASFTLGAGQEIEFLLAATPTGLALTGNALANTLVGNTGSDTLDGGGGADWLIGGAGGDTFLFGTPLVGGTPAAIIDFTQGADDIALAQSAFGAAGPAGMLAAAAFFAGVAAHDADDRIVYDAGTGRLSYDADGNGAGAATVFVTVTPGSSLSASDFHIV